MTETTKTASFLGAAAVMLGIGTWVAWPTPVSNDTQQVAGTDMFGTFTDPLAAANLKIVTFDEVQGELRSFEVRKDAETKQWSIPSRSGYPADAVEQMKDAANSLVGLKILDIQTENAEDHDDLGVVEPRPDDLEIGDEGVGRLVTFRDAASKVLASLIIGYPVKNEPGKIYVRKPGEDPVYVVKLDDSPLTTKFQDWIEDDLLQLSSINIQGVQIDDYSTSISGRGQIDLTRNFVAKVKADGTKWVIQELAEYDNQDPLAEPTPVAAAAGTPANQAKMDELKNALDELKIVDVLRKPDGMSANLRADKELVSDTEALQSLAVRGFFPIENASGETEILSANGDLNVTLNDGVQYVLRFGNVESLGEAEAANEGQPQQAGGANRYLLVTTNVDESQFPPPPLAEVPDSVDDLQAIYGKKTEPAGDEPAGDEPTGDEPTGDEPAGDESAGDESAGDESAMDRPQPAADGEADASTPGAEKSDASAPAVTEQPDAQDAAVQTQGAAENEATIQATVSGEGAQDEPTQEAVDQQADQQSSPADQPAPGDDADQPAAAAKTLSAGPPVAATDTVVDSQEITFEEMTDEEKEELLSAEQEKVRKANQRLLDARTEKLEAAKRRVRDLNSRFADWYYVIPEATYRQLRISREELVKEDTADASAPEGLPFNGSTGPSF